MKSFVFLNRKGGTGKTSLSVAASLALSQKGKKVLLVDCDPQGNSSSWLAKDFSHELADVLIGKQTADKVVVPCSVVDAPLDIMPTFAIGGNLQTYAASTRNYYAIEDAVFSSIGKLYDYIIFDTSPAFGDFEKGIAVCADVIVPVLKLDQFSADGFQTLIENLETTTKELRCKDLLDKIHFVLLNQQDKRMKFQSLFAENFIRSFEDTQFLTVPTDTGFVKAQILKKSLDDKAISARKETLESLEKLASMMETILL